MPFGRGILVMSPAGSARFRRGPAVAVGAALALLAAASGDAEVRDVLVGPVPAEVVSILDGDTISVRAHIWLGQDVDTHVRLAGIDAPELHGKCPRERRMAAAAREFLAQRLADRRVTLRDVQVDKYGGRVRARVTTDRGDDIADALLQAGLARPYGGAARRPWCE
jgi:endonuclease YncB( thermonuclease family)